MRGFTLVELLVVIGIMGILTSVLLMTLNPLEQVKKGRDAQRKSDLGNMQKALDTYYNDKNSYPAQTAEFQIAGAPWGSAWLPYIVKVPKDPTASFKYIYTSTTGQSYQLYAYLERENKDPQVCTSDSCTSKSCGTNVKCNYGVSSSNTTP